MRALGFAGLVLLAATAASADPRDEALSAMLRCSGTSDKAQRLACYDTAVVRLPGALNAPAPQAPAPQTASAAPTVAAPAPVRRVRKGFLSGIFGGTATRAPQTTVAQFGSRVSPMVAASPNRGPSMATPLIKSTLALSAMTWRAGS